jgi:hypothetical protein
MSAPTARATQREPVAGHVRAGDFRHRAACRSVDPEVFFPTAVEGRQFQAQVSIAKTVCARCPVLDECRAWALVTGLSDGIAGGMTEHERRTELTRRRGSRRGRLPRPRVPQRPAGGTRSEIAAAGQAAIAAGMTVREAAGEFLVSMRTAGRWAQAVRTSSGTAAASTCTTSAREGSTGGNRAPLQISPTNPSQGHERKDTEGR